MDGETDHLVLRNGVVVPGEALQFRFDRSGGPGGQNVNKVNTKATLTVDRAQLESRLPEYARQRLPTVASRYLTDGKLVVSSDESRSQHTNRQDCLDKLRHVLNQALTQPTPRRATRPSRGAKERRIRAKKQRGQRKQDRQQRPSSNDH